MPSSSPEDWRRIRAVFEGALALPAAERRAYVGEVCGNEDALRCQVLALLDAHDRAGAFMETPAAGLFGTAPPTVASANAAAATSGIDPSIAVAQPLSAFHVGSEFRGTERYAVVRPLGAGGMGVVYEVHDRARDQVVALKTLRQAGAGDVLRLKREFRSLADIAHANLVSLYELFVDAEHCFFTMELVEGQRISDYIREPLSHPPTKSPSRAERARNALRQLVSGVLELHGHGKLHRDIKPSNVLVTPEGRVVILDFGLVSDVVPSNLATNDRRGGTRAYLAPELLGGAAPSEASDWYSVGVTLDEALTGRPPLTGALERLLEGDAEYDVDGSEVPDDLRAIRRGLLHRDPTERLSGRDVLSRLAFDSTVGSEPIQVEARRQEPPLVGRAEPLAVLREAFVHARSGRGATVYIHGRSGIGKSALLRHFIDEIAAVDGVLVLRGRCYEHESVPYRALDGVIDNLSAYLNALSTTNARSLMPPAVGALARVFPVMLQVEAVATALGADTGSLDPSSQRRQAFTALRDLLTRMADRRTIVLCIDDLHWADADSTRLLEELLMASEPLPILTLVCFRTEEMATKPFLQSLLDRPGEARRTTVALDPLTQDEALELLGWLIPSERDVGEAQRLEIARDARGSPFLLEQLAHYAASVRAAHGTVTFGDMLEHRLRGLSSAARRFLEVLVVSGRPMASQWIHEAAGLAGDDRPLAARLRVDHLARHSGSAARLEVFHDRIRETLAARLAPDRVRFIHESLLRTLLARGSDDSEALFEHARGAGDGAVASHHAASAAAKAAAALAFDKAALLYRNALELAPSSPAAEQWHEGLAEALTNAGRPHAAAEVYLDASRRGDRIRQVELQRRAAEQFLIGGHIDRGLNVIASVLRALNMRLARGPLTALVLTLWRRAGIRWRGLSFAEREAAAVPAETLLSIDTCWSVATGLAMVDYVRAAPFTARHVQLALDAGEPYRVARALALEAVFLSSAGASRKFAAACGDRAAVLAQRTGHPHALALSTLSQGATAVMAGEWKKAAVLCDRVLDTLRTSCAGATWETSCAQGFLLGALLFRGEIREVSSRLPLLLTDAKDRGNLYLETELRTRMNLVWLAADDAEEGERQANEALQRWSQERFHRQHYNHVLARVQTALYRGRAEQAWELITANWSSIERAMLRRIRFFRVETAYLRARCALLMAMDGQASDRFVSIARGDARRIRRVGMRWSDPIAMLVDAGAAYLGGDPIVARTRLAVAADAFDAADMKLYAAVARRRLGAITGDASGQKLVRDAEDWMSLQGIRGPDGITRLLAPGFPDPPASKSVPSGHSPARARGQPAQTLPT